MGVDILSFAYAATVAAGGIMGYAKAGVGAYQLSQDPSNYTLMLGTTSTLGGLMGYRYYNSRKFMPAGLVFCMSVGMLAKIVFKHVSAPSAIASKG
ncbi:hypothetical protein HF086_011973 [Spodoptera exigua]|uniref:Transmembrane protein 14C n=1 Tax=Spodoptera exigua TaxID=7107 RepID=A0A922MHL2_SPOEX|nr:hypothetical protein HF086_011973 [Spodoptera exigua]